MTGRGSTCETSTLATPVLRASTRREQTSGQHSHAELAEGAPTLTNRREVTSIVGASATDKSSDCSVGSSVVPVAWPTSMSRPCQLPALGCRRVTRPGTLWPAIPLPLPTREHRPGNEERPAGWREPPRQGAGAPRRSIAPVPRPMIKRDQADRFFTVGGEPCNCYPERARQAERAARLDQRAWRTGPLRSPGLREVSARPHRPRLVLLRRLLRPTAGFVKGAGEINARLS
jgi:hypothetical protein